MKKEEIKEILDEYFDEITEGYIYQECEHGDGIISVEEFTEKIVRFIRIYVSDETDSIDEGRLTEPIVRELLSSKQYQDAMEKIISENGLFAKD